MLYIISIINIVLLGCAMFGWIPMEIPAVFLVSLMVVGIIVSFLSNAKKHDT